MGKKCLLMVDVQKEFKDKNGGYEKCIKYFNENKDKYDRIYATIFENNENINPRYINHLNWNECKNTDESSLEFGDKMCPFTMKKFGYGLKPTAIDLRFKPGETVDIIGCDAEACVMAVAFSFWDYTIKPEPIHFTILSDYIYTTSDFPIEETIKIMRHLFGDCVK